MKQSSSQNPESEPQLEPYPTKSRFGFLTALAVFLAFGFLIMLCLPRFQGARMAAMASRSTTNLNRMAAALHNYHKEHGAFPSGATVDSKQVAYHSWMTLILPFHDYENDPPDLYDRIDLDIPWNHPDNAAPFSIVIPRFLNPVVGDGKTTTGYGMSHYAANKNLFYENSQIHYKNDIPDGTSNTIMCGEIKDNLPAWGDPANSRDPALGINTGPDGFGNPGRVGAYMLLVDGSVIYITKHTDPAIIKALSTPAGGEDMTDMEF